MVLTSFNGKPVLHYKASPVTTSNAPYSISGSFTKLYAALDLESMGLSQQAFEYACKGYSHLVNTNQLSAGGYLTICDLSQSSHKKRLYVIDMTNRKVILNTYVAHGRNSGLDYATRFSNQPESLQSSLGFYITASTYQGSNGLSLKMRGLEPGFNDKAWQRAIVIHGADYIGPQRLQNAYMGRSYGCPAVPRAESGKLINLIKNGNCVFIYSNDKNYLHHSTILNA